MASYLFNIYDGNTGGLKSISESKVGSFAVGTDKYYGIYFDTGRKSIWTQNTEFGRSSDIDTEGQNAYELFSYHTLGITQLASIGDNYTTYALTYLITDNPGNASSHTLTYGVSPVPTQLYVDEANEALSYEIEKNAFVSAAAFSYLYDLHIAYTHTLTIKDHNGNDISFNGSSNVYIDSTYQSTYSTYSTYTTYSTYASNYNVAIERSGSVTSGVVTNLYNNNGKITVSYTSLTGSYSTNNGFVIGYTQSNTGKISVSLRNFDSSQISSNSIVELSISNSNPTKYITYTYINELGHLYNTYSFVYTNTVNYKYHEFGIIPCSYISDNYTTYALTYLITDNPGNAASHTLTYGVSPVPTKLYIDEAAEALSYEIEKNAFVSASAFSYLYDLHLAYIHTLTIKDDNGNNISFNGSSNVYVDSTYQSAYSTYSTYTTYSSYSTYYNSGIERSGSTTSGVITNLYNNNGKITVSYTSLTGSYTTNNGFIVGYTQSNVGKISVSVRNFNSTQVSSGSTIELSTSSSNPTKYITYTYINELGHLYNTYSFVYTNTVNYKYHEFDITQLAYIGDNYTTYVLNGLSTTNPGNNASHTISYSLSPVPTKLYVDETNEALSYEIEKNAFVSAAAFSYLYDLHLAYTHTLTIKDHNGNDISFNGSSNVYVDLNTDLFSKFENDTTNNSIKLKIGNIEKSLVINYSFSADKLNFERVSDMHATTGWRFFTLNNRTPSNGPSSAGWAQGVTFLPNNDTGGYRHIITFWGESINNDLWIKNQWNGTWGSWRKILDSNNFNNYSPTLTGGGASGTWNINITGNANSASSVAWANITGKATSKTAWGQTFVDASGNIQSISGNMTSVGQVTPDGNATRDNGTSSANWATVYSYALRSNDNLTLRSGTSKDIIFQTNAGTEHMRLLSGGTLILDPGSVSNWGEGLRIHQASNGWATLALGGTSNSGTSAAVWSLHTCNNNFYLANNGSDSFTNGIKCVSGVWSILGGNVGIGNTSPSYKLHVSGDVYANGGWLRSSGSTGWYNESYSGGWYMNDSTYVRVYNSKRVYNSNTEQYAFYTAGGFTGAGFYKAGSSNDYVLTGAGGHKQWSTSKVANTIVARTGDNYIYAGYYNSDISNEDSMSPTSVYCSNDNWIRKQSISKFADNLRSNEIISIDKSLTITEAWMDTGIVCDATTFPRGTGTYAVQVCAASMTSDSYYPYYSGIMTIYTSTTNSSGNDEVALHCAGYAVGTSYKRLYIRTQEQATPNYNKIQIAGSSNLSKAYTITFKFRKLI